MITDEDKEEIRKKVDMATKDLISIQSELDNHRLENIKNEIVEDYMNKI